MGLKDFFVTSQGESILIPQLYRKFKKWLRRLQKQLSFVLKGSKRSLKAIKIEAKKHNKVADKRKFFHFKVANKLLFENEVIAHEDLNIKGRASTRLSKSINDARRSILVYSRC